MKFTSIATWHILKMNSMKQKLIDAFDAHSDAIYRHCYFRVFKKTRAEELVQETYMKTWDYMKKGNKIDNVRAFLYKVANNLIIDESRKRKEESLDDLLEQNIFIEPSYREDKIFEHNILLAEVKEKMKKLPEEDQKMITLRYFDDLDPKDISEITGDNKNNVSVKLNRAIHKLRQII